MFSTSLPKSADEKPLGLVTVEEGTGTLVDMRRNPQGRDEMRYHVMMEPIDRYGKVVFKLRLVCVETKECSHENYFFWVDAMSKDGRGGFFVEEIKIEIFRNAVLYV